MNGIKMKKYGTRKKSKFRIESTNSKTMKYMFYFYSINFVSVVSPFSWKSNQLCIFATLLNHFYILRLHPKSCNLEPS